MFTRLKTLNRLKFNQFRTFSTQNKSKESEQFFSFHTITRIALFGVGSACLGVLSASYLVRNNTLERRVNSLENEVLKIKIGQKNKAFVFIKPHAVNSSVEDFISSKFRKHNIKILESGYIKGKKIDEEKLIDRHYGSLAKKAIELKPSELSLTDEAKIKFKSLSSGVSWENALEKNLIKNAKQFCDAHQLSGDELNIKWRNLEKKGNLVKFGGGFYCGKLGDSNFVINGFYPAMREQFTKRSIKIKFYVVEWTSSSLSWSDFRNLILGSTNPSKAVKGSLRRDIHDNWRKLNLKEKPSTGKNCVHGSASPFESLGERLNWLQKEENLIQTDELYQILIKNGLKIKDIKKYLEDPTVTYNNKSASFFDLVEDLDSDECFEKIIEIHQQQQNHEIKS